MRQQPLFLIDFLKLSAALLIILHHLSSYGQIAEDARSLLPGLMTWEILEHKLLLSIVNIY